MSRKHCAVKFVSEELQLDQVTGGVALMSETNATEAITPSGSQNPELIPGERSDLNEGQLADFRRIAEQRCGKRSQPRR